MDIQVNIPSIDLTTFGPEHFEAVCDCGGLIVSREAGSATCPKCGTVAVIEWGYIKAKETKAA